jgi:hypothetical protein
MWGGFGDGFGVGINVPITRPNPVFWNRGKPKPVPKPSQLGFSPSKRVWFGRVPAGMGFIAMPSSNKKQASFLTYKKDRNFQ